MELRWAWFCCRQWVVLCNPSELLNYNLRAASSLHPLQTQIVFAHRVWFIYISSLEIFVRNALKKQKHILEFKKLKSVCFLWLSCICIGMNEHTSDTFRAPRISPFIQCWLLLWVLSFSFFLFNFISLLSHWERGKRHIPDTENQNWETKAAQ